MATMTTLQEIKMITVENIQGARQSTGCSMAQTSFCGAEAQL